MTTQNESEKYTSNDKHYVVIIFLFIDYISKNRVFNTKYQLLFRFLGFVIFFYHKLNTIYIT